MSAIQKINNIIYKKVPVGQFVRSNGEKIVLSVATETELWKRPVEVAVEHGPALERAVKDNLDKIDDNVKEITSREPTRTSKKDPANHVTTLQTTEVSDDNNVSTVGKIKHLPVREDSDNGTQ